MTKRLIVILLLCALALVAAAGADSPAPSSGCTVQFFAGYDDPAQTMDPVLVDAGASYELPACGFTAPEGRVFSGWSVVVGEAGAVSMQPGETVEVTADTAVSAVWGLEPVYYIDAHGVRQGPVTDYTLVTETTEDWNRSGSDSGWYVVRGTVEINTHEGARVRVNNTGVNLILCDGATLIAPWGITVNAGTGLTIWAQSKGGAKGALIADCSRIFWEDNYSAIGGFGVSCGTITINGGYIEAAGGSAGAGIGSAGRGSTGGTITINAGNVYAYGGGAGAGIGGSFHGGGGTTVINGGYVSARGGEGSAGIGGGANGPGGTITITGGEVYAVGGSGDNGDWSTTDTFQAGAGIGGGGARTWSNIQTPINAGGGTITITGGNVYAFGGESGKAPGIGYGENGEDCGATIRLTYNDSNPFTIVQTNAYGGSLTLEKWFTNTTKNTAHEGVISNLDVLKDSRLVPRYALLIFVSHTDQGDITADKGMAFSGDTVTLTAEPAEGYGFVSWSVKRRDTNEDVEVTGNTFIMPPAEVNVSAVWDLAFTVSFVPGGGTGGMDAVTCINGGTYPLPACGFTAPEGMGFREWSVQIGNTAAQAKAPGDTIAVTADTAVTAVWEELLTVTFDAGGGTGTMDAVRALRGSVYVLPDNGFEAPDGKRFRDWTVILPGSVHRLNNLPGETIEIYGDITLLAVWQPIPFGTADFGIPGDVTVIEDSAFRGVAATVVEIPENCTFIGNDAFRDCSQLTMIRIPAGCELGDRVFDGCTKVYVFGTPGSDAERYCTENANCVFVEDARD